MRSWIYNLKFRNQIIIIFSGILFFICVLSGVAFYYLSSQNIKDNFVKSAEDSVIQIEDTLETRIGIIEGKCKSMLINQTFYNTLSQGVDNFNVNTVAETVDVIEGYISDFEYGEDLISSSYLYTDYNDYYSYIHYRVPEFDFKKFNPLSTMHGAGPFKRVLDTSRGRRYFPGKQRGNTLCETIYNRKRTG